MREVDLVIAGLGIRINHVTPETLDALQSSRVVFYVGKAPGVRELIESCCAEAVDLSTAYRENVDRFETYKFMAAVIVDAALSRSPVTFAEYGHPLVLAQPSVLTVRAATRLGLRTRVLPARGARTASPWPPSIPWFPNEPPATHWEVTPARQFGHVRSQ